MRILTLLLLSISLFATDYDNLLLRAQASMFPKIILLDKNIQEKTTDSTVSLGIVYNDGESEEAYVVKNLIDDKYKGKLGKYKFQVHLINANNFRDTDSSSAYYFFNSSDVKKQEIISHAINHKRISFSYNYKDFRDKTLISIFLKEKTYIYVNKATVSEYNIKFAPIFYKIAKVR